MIELLELRLPPGGRRHIGDANHQVGGIVPGYAITSAKKIDAKPNDVKTTTAESGDILAPVHCPDAMSNNSQPLQLVKVG